MKFDSTVITTKIPHHSQHSGYEQLIKYLPNSEILHFDRGHANSALNLAIERFLRRFSASRWYQWDGVLGDIVATKRLIYENQIVHFLYGDASIGLIPYIKHALKGKLVLTVHACPSDMTEVLQYPHMITAADALILLGENQKQFFLDLGMPESKLCVIPHGVDTTFFKPMAMKPVMKALNVLMVGNWRRNFEMYKKVMELSAQKEIVFHVVTQPFNHHYFRGLNNVKLYSGISDESLRSMYQFSDVMVLGLEDAVANNVLLEAAACGLPIIAERVGAVDAYLGDDAVNYVEKNDAQSIVNHLNSALENRSVFLQKAEIALKKVQSFSWEIVAKETQKVYSSLY